MAGMKTGCGAVLIPTQFTDTVEWSNGASGSLTAKAVAEMSVAPGIQSVQAVEASLNPFDEQPQLPRLVSNGVPYLIITPEGKRISGSTDISGKLPRVVTEGEAEYEVFWGDEALARMESDDGTGKAAG